MAAVVAMLFFVLLNIHNNLEKVDKGTKDRNFIISCIEKGNKLEVCKEILKGNSP